MAGLAVAGISGFLGGRLGEDWERLEREKEGVSEDVSGVKRHRSP